MRNAKDELQPYYKYDNTKISYDLIDTKLFITLDKSEFHIKATRAKRNVAMLLLLRRTRNVAMLLLLRRTTNVALLLLLRRPLRYGVCAFVKIREQTTVVLEQR